MTVAELIELLSKMDPKATVVMPESLPIVNVVCSDGYVYLSDLSDDELYENYKLDEEGFFFADDYAAVD